MKKRRWTVESVTLQLILLMLMLIAATAVQAANINLNVVDQDGNAVNGFRWLLQEDTTFVVKPNNPATKPEDLLAMSFHKSYHPVARRIGNGATAGDGLSGNSDGSNVQITDVRKGNNNNPTRYYVSVLPYSGYSIGGAPVEVGRNDPTVTVVVQNHPIPTAQIAVYLFHDNAPINGVPDLPVENNPAAGDLGHVDWSQFNIIVEEPAGRYGIAGGQVIQDAFGNPLGTTYDNGGNVMDLGDGTIHPNSDGTLLIKNLAPGKYGIVAIPPTGSNWQQTSTIEGSKVIDTWVKANEPPFFVEFGLPGPHAFIGFVKSTSDGGFPPLQDGVATVSGNITDMHMSRSPTTEFFSGRPFPGCWVGLNDATVGLGEGIYAEPCNGDSSFEIASVPPGSYQLAVWDANMDAVIAALPFTVDSSGTCNGGGSCDFGDVAVFNWFHRINTAVFNDDNENGFWDNNEIGIGPESQGVTLRWRDGTVYQAFPTDNEGFAPFDEVFPFFHWLVAEVDFVNKKATGATFVIDNGGDPDPAWGKELTPQAQCIDDGSGTGATVGHSGLNTCPPNTADINPNTQDNLSRTETGPVLTAAFQGFLGQTNVMQFGKKDYVTFTQPDFNQVPPITYVGENGGISGIVYYATTRAEDDPRFAAAEEWEPGVPRIQVALYADGDILGFGNSPLNFPNGVGDVDWNGDGILDPDDGIIDDVNQNGIQGELADVDNAPLGWGDPNCVNDRAIPGNECKRGKEDIRQDNKGGFDYGDALQVTWTDSWDDNLPTGCQGETFFMDGDTAKPTDCFDGLRNFNQIRPGVFDGGYAFDAYDLSKLPAATLAQLNAFYNQPAVASLGIAGILPADYIVETATPPGYEMLREEHKNVDFGDVFEPTPQALASVCVGDDHVVPRYLQMQTVPDAAEIDGRRPVVAAADLVDAPFTGETRPLCDRKQVPLSAGQNAAADFFLMTDVPTVANVSGVILNDLANEFDPNSPSFGEKFAPPTVPVAFYDWNGNLVNRVYADQFGRFNAVLPSTYTANLPQPSGMSPNMLTSCMNDAGPLPNGQIDPFFDPQYSQFCYTFQYMPGVITYLDTPVVPIAAFAGPGQFPVDCELPTKTPMIASVERLNNGGGGPFVLPGQQIRIQSMGKVQVPNPEWDGIRLRDKTIKRDYRFGGNPGSGGLYLEDAGGVRIQIPVGNGPWNQNRIDATIPGSVTPGEYQVVVVHNNGIESPTGITLTVGTNAGGGEKGVRPDGGTYDVWSVPGNFATIQDAIDGAAAGDLILVAPGVYNELVIMWKPVKLQGWGAGAVTINARQAPTEKIQEWRDLAASLDASGAIDRLPGQALAPFAFPALAEALFPTEEGAGIFVAGKRTGTNRFGLLANRGARIDGFSILGASTGGGIIANGYNQFLNISNNRLIANAGFYGGGIRVGHPQLSHETAGNELVYDDAVNDNIRIHHNQVIKNGGFNGAGGGISLHTGADRYRVQDNWICGNFSQGDGGGIGHLGLSDNGLIEDNTIIFNETFNQAVGTTPSGGGIFIGGQPGLVPNGDNLVLTPGTGDVIIDGNLIRGNLAGAGDGAGIRIANVNGLDVAANLGNLQTPAERWHRLFVFNNMINNNVAGVAGGGISLSDALDVVVRNNTVANNDSTSTGSAAFMAGVTPNQSEPLPAGIVSRLHSPDLAALMSFIDPSVLPIPGSNPSGRAAQTWIAFSDPVLRDDIIYHNRSFYWANFDNPATPVIETGLVPATCAPNDASCNVVTENVDNYSEDLGVLDGNLVTADQLNPLFSLLTDTSGYHGSNTAGNPAFVNGYFNESRDGLLQTEFKTLQTAAAFDEGGNFIQVAFGPLSLLQPGAAANPANNTTLFDYHVGAGSAAINNGGSTPATGRLSVDFDNQARPNGLPEIGADELY